MAYNDFCIVLRNAKKNIQRYIGNLSFTKDRIKLSSLQTLALALLLSKLLTSCLTAVNFHGIRYCTKVYDRSRKKSVLVYKNSGEVLSILNSREFRVTSLSIYDYFDSHILTTLTHNLNEVKLLDLIEPKEGRNT